MKEIWKKIPGHENYQASSLGRIKSLARLSANGHKLKEKILKIGVDCYGYKYVRADVLNRKVHKLVAMAFLNHTPCGLKVVVDHIDNNKLNNHIDNLQLISQRQNTSKDKNPKSGFTGVWLNGKKWGSRITFKGRKLYLGTFNTPEEASEVYQKFILENNLQKVF